MKAKILVKMPAQILSSSLSCGKWQNSFSAQTEIFMGLISFSSAFDITFWKQWRKSSMNQ